MRALVPGAEPFLFPGGETRILLVHGFTGSPKEMRWLGERLHGAGFTVLGVRLFGHATKMDDMLRARREDWLACLEDGYHILGGPKSRIVVAGLSMGGALSLVFGSRFPVAGVAAMSTPYELPPHPLARWLRPLRGLIPLIGLFWRYASKVAIGWHDAEAASDHFEYPAYPIRSGLELDALLLEMRRALPAISAPVLLMHARHDPAVPPAHMPAIYGDLRTSDKRMVWFEESGHVLTKDAQREQVFAEVADFAKRLGGGASWRRTPDADSGEKRLGGGEA